MVLRVRSLGLASTQSQARSRKPARPQSQARSRKLERPTSQPFTYIDIALYVYCIGCLLRNAIQTNVSNVDQSRGDDEHIYVPYVTFYRK